MASKYPKELDALTTATEDRTDSKTGAPKEGEPAGSGHHADLHNDANEAINKVQETLGTEPQGGSATVSARIAAEAAARAIADGLRELLANKDTDATLAANSDTKYPSQKAIKAYVDGLLAASDAVVYKGVKDCSGNPNYPAASAGHLYVVSVAGKIGGASGTEVEVGDFLIGRTDGSAEGTQAAVGANWNVIQTNLVGAVTGPTSSTSGNISIFSGTTGKVVQDSGRSHSTDATLAGNSDSLIPTQKAVKGYVDTATGLLVPKSLIDAKGDLFAGTADNAVGRVAVGSDGQVLTADSSQAAGVKWATPSASSGTGTPAARFATATALPANTRTSNVLEANANGALSVDGGSPAEGNLILVKDEATGANNGLYKVLAPGAAGSKWKLERATAMDSSEECVPGMLIMVAEGTVNADSTWQLTTNATITLNTTALTFLPTKGPAIGCSVRRTTSLTVPNSTATMMPWTDAGGTIGYNVGPCWAEANPNRLVMPVPGLYSLTGSIQYDDENVTTGERSVFVTLNGGSTNTLFQNQHSFSGRNGRALGFAVQFRCTTAGDYMEVGFFQDSGSSRKIEPDQYGTGFEICRATLERIR